MTEQTLEQQRTMLEYQYSFHRQRVDEFFPLVEMGQPNMQRLEIIGEIDKWAFREYCEFLRDHAEDYGYRQSDYPTRMRNIDIRVQNMGAAW